MILNQLHEPAQGRPYVVMMSAPTMDGKMTVKRGMKGSLAPYARKELAVELAEMRAAVDGVMVGGNTVVVDNPSLTVRGVPGNNPYRVIVDPEGVIPLNSKVLNDGKAVTKVAVAESTDRERIARLQGIEGVQVIVAGDGPHVDLPSLMEELRMQGLETLLIEGGGTLNWYMLSGGLVDEVRLLYLPVIVGGSDNVTLAEGVGSEGHDDVVRLTLAEFKLIGDFPFFRLEVIGHRDTP